MNKLIAMFFLCFLLVSCSKKQANELYVFTWFGYIPDTILLNFEKETGIKVHLSGYDSNEAMYAMIKKIGGNDYDVIVPSTYFIKRLADEGLIQPLDLSKISNFAKLDKRIINREFDPKNKYTIPFLWGTTGIGLKSKCANKIKITAWKDLWDPRLKGRIMLQDDAREAFHIALRKLGYSSNTTNENEIAEAYEELKKLMPSVRLFNSTAPKIPIFNEDICVANMWSGEAFSAAANIDLEYIYPEEGALIWADNFAISSKAKNIDSAYLFIDFLIRPDISAAISNMTGYTSPTENITGFLNKNLRTSRVVYPTDEDIKNGEFQLDIGETSKIYEKYWKKLTAEK